ncbi:hypothetical protein KEM54_002433 [Ascosphaera aggregata]|nr:hypothetical protein KEM54_002433 [Ascosphaera aggregata]
MAVISSRRLQPVATQLRLCQSQTLQHTQSNADANANAKPGNHFKDVDDMFASVAQAINEDRSAGNVLRSDLQPQSLEKVLHTHPTQSVPQTSSGELTTEDRSARRRAKVRRIRQNQLYTDAGPDAASHSWRLRYTLPDHWLASMSTSHLDNLLNNVAGHRADMHGCLRILREMLTERRLKPDVGYYKALILSNTDAAAGSAHQIRALLDEMEANHIPADSPTLHAALRALAVHPDYILRQDVLRMLRNRWLSVSPMGWHYIVVGLIRENQFEMALHAISTMEAKHIQLNEWVFDLLIYSLCNVEEYDAILDLMKSRTEWGGDISPTLWFHLLDRASFAMHEPCVELCWKTKVETGLIYPSFGICAQVLRITARSGNAKLANAVFRTMQARKSPRSIDHYESLIDTYLTSHDLENAICVLCELSRMTMFVSESSSRSILSRLISLNRPGEDYWELLKTIAVRRKIDIPPAVANLVFEYCAHRQTMTLAMRLFQDYHTLVPAGPDSETVNYCIAGCRAAMDSVDEAFRKQSKLAGWFLQEMIDLKILPNRRSYEEIILWCLASKKYEEAWNYFQEMLDNRFEITSKVAKTIRTMCFEVNDVHAKKLQTHAKLRKAFGKELVWHEYRFSRQMGRQNDDTSLPIRPVVYNPPTNYGDRMWSERIRLRREKDEIDAAFRKEVEAEFYDPYWYNKKAHEIRRLRRGESTKNKPS